MQNYFLEMKPNYNDLLSECFGPGKARLHDRKGARRNVVLPCPEPPLVSRPFWVKTLRSDMEATSQISWEARDSIIKNVHSGLGGVDVFLNWPRADENARTNFLEYTYEEIDNMSVEYLKTYANICHNGWHDLIFHDEEGMGMVYVNG